MAATAKKMDIEIEDFAKLLEEHGQSENESFEGRVVKGRVVRVEGDMIVVDVGLKSEGRIPRKEFGANAEGSEIKVDDEVEVYVERMENKEGEAVLSRERARREEVWVELEKSHTKSEPVTGVIFNKVKGGFMVDIDGAIAFLPSSQVDIRPIKDPSVLMNKPQPFMILKMDRKRGNIVVSRRAILEESRSETRSELMGSMKEGLVVEGLVKNITDYGAFIDLGGLDGLLHLTDISWKRINHPSEVLTLGQSIKVQVIKYNQENGRISLGMKQLEKDPWDEVEILYPLQTKFKGRVTNITDYGAFVELDDGIEGLIHVSEMSWTKSGAHPGKIVSTSQEVEVMILEIDRDKRRISLGLKQCQSNPWAYFEEKYPAGTELEGEVKNLTDFGLFMDLPEGLDGMVHVSDISWDKSGEEALKDFEKGQNIKVKVIDIDPSKERISLGIKQLQDDPYGEIFEGLKKGQVVTGTVTLIQDKSVDVEVQGITGTIKKNDLGRDRADQRPDRFAVGEKVDAVITRIDKMGRKLELSIKSREIQEEKDAMKEYGSTDSGAQLGEILGGVLSKAKEDAPEKEAKKKAPAKKAAPKAKAKKEEKTEAADDAAKEKTEK